MGTLFLFLFLSFLQPSQAQPSSLSLHFQRAGFDKIDISFSNYTLYITLENHHYRSDANALYQILKTVYQDNIYKETIFISLKHEDIPIFHLTTTPQKLKDLFESQIPFRGWLESSIAEPDTPERKNTTPTTQNSSRNNSPTILELNWLPKYQLGNYNEPFRMALDVTPTLIQYLPLGLRLTTAVSLPVYNNLDKNRHLRLSRLAITHQKALRPGLYAGAGAGIFSRNRAGLHGQLTQYLRDEILALTFQAGYTIFTPLTGRVENDFAEQQPFMVFTGAASYRWKTYDLDIRLEYGQFLYRDTGFKVDVQRHFGETIIGMFGLKTRLGTNYGFHVSIPLLPRKGYKMSGVRIRSASHLPVTYRYEGNDLTGRMYDTGLDLQKRLQRVYPSYLMDELEDLFR